MENIEKLKQEIAERLKPLNPEKIVLFGSYARGEQNKESDIDLYVVTNDNFMPESYATKRELVRKISKQIEDIREKYNIDLLVHTKMMSNKFFRLNSSFSREISKNGKVIYEQRNS